MLPTLPHPQRLTTGRGGAGVMSSPCLGSPGLSLSPPLPSPFPLLLSSSTPPPTFLHPSPALPCPLLFPFLLFLPPLFPPPSSLPLPFSLSWSPPLVSDCC